MSATVLPAVENMAQNKQSFSQDALSVVGNTDKSTNNYKKCDNSSNSGMCLFVCLFF